MGSNETKIEKVFKNIHTVFHIFKNGFMKNMSNIKMLNFPHCEVQTKCGDLKRFTLTQILLGINYGALKLQFSTTGFWIYQNHIMWKNENLTLTQKIFREIICLVAL